MQSINSLKQQSGATHFASVMGKSTINRESPEYAMIERATEILFQNGYGVIHGGYAGGAMSAVSDTANKYIKENNLSPFLNIGVPQVEHDGLWPRVDDASFTDVAQDIFQRLRVVTSGDIVVVCPLGGEGTELEETIVFHENVVRAGMNKYGGHNKKMTPLIFLQTPNGTNWKYLIEQKLKTLDTSVRDIAEYQWLYFIDTLEEFEKCIHTLQL